MESDREVVFEMSLSGESAELFSFLGSVLRISTPLIFAAMGGLICERSGVINMALEGFMLLGAFAAAAVTSLTHFAGLGALAALFLGLAAGSLYGLCVLKFRANQIVAGTAVNLLAVGLTPFLCKIFYGSSSATPSLQMSDRFQLAPIWVALFLGALVVFWSKNMVSGLQVHFAGEHPEALESAGVRVRKVRLIAILTSGALAGLGGACLSIFLSSSFSRGMTAGRGFIALAAIVFGKWKPMPTLFACLFFGIVEAFQIRLQGTKLWGQLEIPIQLIQVLPYFMTVLILAGFVGKCRPPKALGLHF